MANWHHNWKTDIALRVCGAMSCGLSYLSIHALIDMRLADGTLPDDAVPFILAASGFLCASVGATLLALGHHIFDEVVISPPWRNPFPAEDVSTTTDAFARSDTTRCDGHFPSVTINQDNIRAINLVHRA